MPCCAKTSCRAGLSNVGLAVVFHEVERGVSVLHRSIEAGATLEQLRMQAGQLQSVLENSTGSCAKANVRLHRFAILSSRHATCCWAVPGA